MTVCLTGGEEKPSGKRVAVEVLEEVLQLTALMVDSYPETRVSKQVNADQFPGIQGLREVGTFLDRFSAQHPGLSCFSGTTFLMRSMSSRRTVCGSEETLTLKTAGTPA
jgi:hypothetical protein